MRCGEKVNRKNGIEQVVNSWGDVYKILGEFKMADRKESPEFIKRWQDAWQVSSTRAAAGGHRAESAVASAS